MSIHKPIEYTLEIYKPQELQELPAADECRHYHALTQFPAIHVGDHINAWMWKFINDSYQDQVKAMGGRQVEPMVPVAVVTSVMHDLVETRRHTSIEWSFLLVSLTRRSTNAEQGQRGR